MRGTMRTAAVAVLVIASATACTRRVQVESEPNRYEASAAAIDIAGTYDYVVEFDGQNMPGVVTVAPAGAGYAVQMSVQGEAIPTSNVRREGDTLTMDAVTPAGPATLEMTWQRRDAFTGFGYIGGIAHPVTGTRRP